MPDSVPPQGPGFYVIHDKETDCLYVGQTKKLPTRFSMHATQLNYRRHPNRLLQQAFDAGHEFETLFVATASKDEAQAAERFLIRALAPSGVLYNQVGHGELENPNMLPSGRGGPGKLGARKPSMPVSIEGVIYPSTAAAAAALGVAYSTVRDRCNHDRDGLYRTWFYLRKS